MTNKDILDLLGLSLTMDQFTLTSYLFSVGQITIVFILSTARVSLTYLFNYVV